MLGMRLKQLGLFVPKPGAPVFANRGTSTWEGTVVGFQGVLPWGSKGEYSKTYENWNGDHCHTSRHMITAFLARVDGRRYTRTRQG
jgi:hypothetical protein